jgi:hypothetical protein
MMYRKGTEETRNEYRMLKEFCLLGCSAVYLFESQPTFRRYMPPPSSGSKNKSSKKSSMLHAGFLRGLFFDSEDGGDMFHRNIG